MPTYLTILRVVLAIVVIYEIGRGAPLPIILLTFSVAALTDLLDGVIARRYGLVSAFGAKADMIADRVLWAGTALAILLVFGTEDQLKPTDYFQLTAMMSREIIAAPFALRALITHTAFPPVRYLAKVTTFVQGFALPALLISLYYPSWRYLSLPLSVISGGIGVWCARAYILDIHSLRTNATLVKA